MMNLRRMLFVGLSLVAFSHGMAQDIPHPQDEAYPRHLDWTQHEAGSKRHHWIEVPFVEAGRRIEADVRGNTITLQHCDYRHIRLWLSPQLVNVRRRVKVRIREANSGSTASAYRTLYRGKLPSAGPGMPCPPLELKTCRCEE